MRRFAAAALLAFLAAAPGRAEVKDLTSLGRIPVQEGGRVMPLDTYARLRLLQFSGKSTLNRRPALEWLAHMFFVPDAVQTQSVFLVNHPEVAEALGIPETTRRRHTFKELEPGLPKLEELARKANDVPEEDRSPLEKELLQLFVNVNGYLELARAFSFSVPDEHFSVTNAALRQRLKLPEDRTAFTFHDIFQRAAAFSEDLQALKSKDAASWTDEERELFGLSSSLFRWSQFHQEVPPAFIPLTAHGHADWLGPWAAYAVGVRSESVSEQLGRLNDLAAAYRAGRQAEFDLAANALLRTAAKQAPGDRGIRFLNTELLMNRFQPFYRAEMLYGFGFLAALASLLSRGRFWRRAAWVLVAVALVPHTLGLIGRMAIMGRPPVTNLYATFIFVAWVAVLLGLLLELFQRNGLGLFLAGVLGLGLLLVSGRFGTSGDTLSVLVAVLDSNFWLATHVVTISIGYAGCVAAGVAGLVYLVAAAAGARAEMVESAQRATYGLLAFGLVFSFLGTMLGGVWADQSWGRFWGWDPKENGALLIVLWSSILFHARFSRMIGPVGFAVGNVLGIIVVLMAWLGINLLGVGLHSYGFTSGLAIGFWSATGLIILACLALYPLARARLPPTALTKCMP